MMGIVHDALRRDLDRLRAELTTASYPDETQRDALDELDAVLRPHLEREEREAMPLVERTITQREWHDWDQRTNVKPKSMPALANEGLWAARWSRR
jgi:hemerythrin-like domain-containing protein